MSDTNIRHDSRIIATYPLSRTVSDYKGERKWSRMEVLVTKGTNEIIHRFR